MTPSMTAQILHIRDYKTAQEREIEIGRMGLAAVDEALRELPTDFPTQYRAPDDGDVA